MPTQYFVRPQLHESLAPSCSGTCENTLCVAHELSALGIIHAAVPEPALSRSVEQVPPPFELHEVRCAFDFDEQFLRRTEAMPGFKPFRIVVVLAQKDERRRLDPGQI